VRQTIGSPLRVAVKLSLRRLLEMPTRRQVVGIGKGLHLPVRAIGRLGLTSARTNDPSVRTLDAGRRIAGLTLLLGVDRFMNEALAVTNTIGNAVATVVVARWEGVLDRYQFARSLSGQRFPAEE
jgi:hypothetical protein